MSGADFAALLPDVARRLLGDPPRIGADEWRYGSRGSLAVHPARGTWHDFEADAGGGVLDLIEHLQQTDKAGALAWLVDARLIATPAGADVRPAAPPRPAAVPSNRGKPCRNAARAPGSLPESPLRRPVSGPRGPGGTWTRPESAAPALVPPTPKPAPTADVAAAILAAAVPADDTPARAYLAARGTWPADGAGPDLPAAVRWLPPEAVADLPTWPGRDGRPRRLTPPADVQPGAVRSLHGPPAPACGAVVYELARPGEPPDSVTLEAVTADGRRLPWSADPKDTKRTYGSPTGRVFEARSVPGGALWLTESCCNALALAVCGHGGLVRAVGGTSGYCLAAVTDPERRRVVVVPDGDGGGARNARKLREALRPAGRFCSVRYLRAGDVADLLAAWVSEPAGKHAEELAVPVIAGAFAPGPARDKADARAWQDVLTAVDGGARLIDFDPDPEHQ